MTDNIIAMPTPMNILADRIRIAFERTEKGRAEWIEGSLELAVNLKEGRLRCGEDDTQFGMWLVENRLERDKLGPDNRAALINMATNIPLAHRILLESESSSWRLIWELEMKDRFRNAAIAESDNTQIPKPPGPAPEPSNREPPSPETVPKLSGPPETRAVDKRSAIHGLPRAEEVNAIYAGHKAVNVIGRTVQARGGREIWSLILQAIDEGFVTRNDMALATVTARVLFPGSPRAWWQRYDLTNQKHRTELRDVIMPAAIANKEAILKAPHDIERILRLHAHNQAVAAEKEAKQRKIDAARKVMPANQSDIVMFGEWLWPAPEATYDYDQLCCAIWMFEDLNRWFSLSTVGQGAGSRAQMMRFTTKWISEYINHRSGAYLTYTKITKIYTLIDHLSRLLERNPGGECRVPPTPKIEGQW